MSQKKTKHLRKKAAQLMRSLSISPGDGHNEYKYIQNRTDWVPAIGNDGKRMVDQDGVPLIQSVKVDGTVQSQWKYKLFYKFLKKLYKKGDKDIEKILNMSEGDLLDYFHRVKETLP